MKMGEKKRITAMEIILSSTTTTLLSPTITTTTNNNHKLVVLFNNTRRRRIIRRCRNRNRVVMMSSSSSVNETPLRRLILLRHADSSWDDRSLKDHDRPVSKVGETDAIQVSHKLHQLGWIPQLILSSDAARTRQTLEIMQQHVQAFLQAEVRFISSFYSVAAMDGQTAHHLQRAISKYATDDILTLMCMGHNKGWEEAASTLCGVSIELKTCNAALLEAAGKSWDEAFLLAGHGGWKLQQLVKPNDSP